MLILYLFLLLTLLLARLLVAGRARLLERKFARLERQARALHHMPLPRQGNNNRADALALAKQQYLLGNLVQKRDQVEGRYVTWQGRSERLGKWITRVRNVKGRFVPYAAGVADVVLAMAVLGMLEMIDLPTLTRALESLRATRGG